MIEYNSYYHNFGLLYWYQWEYRQQQMGIWYFMGYTTIYIYILANLESNALEMVICG